MLGIEKTLGGVERYFYNGSIPSLYCIGASEDAERSSNNLVFYYGSYSFICNKVKKMFEECKNRKLGKSENISEIYKDGQYIAHWLAHRTYLLYKKIDELNMQKNWVHVLQDLMVMHREQLSERDVRFAALGDIVHNISVDALKNFPREIKNHLILLSSLKGCEDRFANSLDITKSIEKNHVFGDIIEFNKSFLCVLHRDLAYVIEVLFIACQIESVQEDVPLFKEVYYLYSKMECFFPKEKRLDEAFHDKARGIIDQYFKNEDVVIKKSVIQNLIQEIEHLRKEVADLKLQVATVNIEKSQQDLQKSCSITENSEVKWPYFSGTIENKEEQDVAREVPSCYQF